MNKQNKKQPKAKLAYYVSNEDGANILFAHSKNQLLQSGEWEEVIHYPEYDHFVELGFVPAKVLHEDGWEFQCTWCYRVISADNWDYSKDIEIFPIFNGRNAFCCQQCADKAHDFIQRKSQAVEVLKAKYPGVEIKAVDGTGENFFVFLKFPEFPKYSKCIWDSTNPDYLTTQGVDAVTLEETLARYRV